MDGDDPAGWLARHSSAPSLLWISDGAASEADIPQRPWVAAGYLMRGSVTVLAGAGSAGKSQVTIAWACALALGREYGRFTPNGRGRVMIFNVEDDADEQHRRLCATLRQFDAVPSDLGGRLRFLGPAGAAPGLLLEANGDGSGFRHSRLMTEIEQQIIDYRPDVMVLDPLAELHDAEENDNTEIRAVIAAFRALAAQYGFALCICHHVRKGHVEAGNPDVARGGSSIVGAARVVLTIAVMSDDEAGGLGVPLDRRRWYFRIDGAKSNYSAADVAEWHERVLYRLDNEEDCAACVPWEPPRPDLGPEAMAGVLRAIERAHPPMSAKLDSKPRSVRHALEAAGIRGHTGQRKALATLMEHHGVRVRRYVDKRRSASDQPEGLCASGGPGGVTWHD